MDEPAINGKEWEAAAIGYRAPAAGELVPHDDWPEVKRKLLIIEDHLAELDGRLARIEPLLRAVSLARAGLRATIWLFLIPFKLVALLLRWRETWQRVKDARFQSERLVFDSSQSAYMRKVDIPVLTGHLRRSLGLLPPAVYQVEPLQRVALASRPRILHAIANVWVGGSTQLIADLHTHLGHRFEMKVVTSALPAHGSHKGMSIDVVPRHDSRHRMRSVISRFRPHIVHVHYWGSVDERWYRLAFEIAAEFGCPIVQNINTPVAPYTGVRIDHNVYVSRSVLDEFGSAVPA
ncbi:MAG: hypothetical protein L0Y50_08045, partial [Beijerinckiaceae bacterium]|nr:hypothetical protein [Beijerinckiaceae bacterium]